jgi:hypothetical protein
MIIERAGKRPTSDASAWIAPDRGGRGSETKVEPAEAGSLSLWQAG